MINTSDVGQKDTTSASGKRSLLWAKPEATAWDKKIGLTLKLRILAETQKLCKILNERYDKWKWYIF